MTPLASPSGGTSLPALIAALRAQVVRTRARHQRDAFVMLALGIAGLCFYGVSPDARLLVMSSAGVLASLAVLAFVFLSGSWSPAIDRLTQRAGDVVWVFVQVGQRTARWASLTFAFADGTSVAVPVEPSAKDGLLADASMVFATASMGFSAAHRDAFHRDPRTLVGPPRQHPVGAPSPLGSYAWLVDAARAVMFRARIVGACGVALALLGGASVALVLAAAPPGEERAILVGVTSLLALAGLGLALSGFRRFESTPLHRALTTGEGLARVDLVEGNAVNGDVVPMAIVTLKNGVRQTFAAPRSPAPR